MSNGPYPYSLYLTGEARRRMYERGFTLAHVRHVLRTGKKLRRYPEDTPTPSYLMLGWISEEAQFGTYEKGRPVQVVVADAENRTEIITVYEPDPAKWEDDFRWCTSWKFDKNTWRETDE